MNNPEALPLDIVEQQTWLAEHKSSTGLSWSQLAPKIGVPNGTLSQFPTGAYKGDLKKIAEAVYRYRQLLIAQAEIAVEMPEPPAFFDTSTTRRIMTMLTIAQRGRMTVIAGGPGTSKTKSARHYQASVSNVWVATMKPSTGGLMPMQFKVLEALGAEEEKRKGTPIALTSRIESLMRNTGGLLIIDEAQHLTEKSLEEVRSWHDETGVGIALVGNEDVLTRLTLGNRKDAFARLSSRIAQRMIFRGPQDADALALADAWNVTPEDQRAFIVATAKQPGGLRTCTMMLETAFMLASSENNTLQISHLQDAWAHLSIRQMAA
jgi:DNA transposition AAA+ family ATPase